MTNPAFVMVTTSYPMSGGGREAAGSFVADLAEEIARSMPVRVVAPGIETCIEGCDALRIYRYRAPEQPLSTLKPWLPGDVARLFSVMASGRAATETAVAAGPVARLLALWALPSGQWSRRAARRHGIPYSVWTLGSDIWSLGKIPLVRSQLTRVLSQAETCYSDGVQLAKDTARVGGREVAFLPSTRRIESKRTEPLRVEPPYRLLFLGRWHPNKGLDLLLEAIGMLEQHDWSRIESISICGGGMMEEEVSRVVDRMRRVGYPIALRGYLDKSDAEAAIASADFLLIPSRVESIPVVFSDAMKLGCPVVTMPVGDLPSLLLEYHCGVCASQVSASAFAEAMGHALNSSPAFFEEGMSVVARNFDLGRIVDRLVNSVAIEASRDGRLGSA